MAILEGITFMYKLYTKLYNSKVRAMNPARIPGNWSDYEILSIRDIPPPAAITPLVIEVTRSSGDGNAFRIMMEVK